MTGWKRKRFWKDAAAVAEGEGFAVHLDGRPLRTPAKAPLVMPTQPMAEAVADEWRAQGEQVDPLSMPVTRAANAAIDKVMPQFDEVATLTAAYAGTHLQCYRADAPEALIARQAKAWDPLLDWAAQELSAPLEPTSGIVPRPQPRESLERLYEEVHALSPFSLTALNELTSLSGSLIIGLAALAGHMSPDALWRVSRIDEDWQAELWGADEDAAAGAAAKQRDFLQASRFHGLANPAK